MFVPLCSRLFVLLLLLGDYLWDPSLGTSPLSRVLGSTETYCPSMQGAQTVFDALSEHCERPNAPRSTPFALPRVMFHAPLREPLCPASPGPDLLYLYMSLQR